MIRGSVCAGFGYPIVIEPNIPKVEHVSIPIPNLPPKLQGLKIGFLADIHKGLYVSKSDVRVAVKLLMKQRPDIICLGGDFVQGRAENIHPFRSDEHGRVRTDQGQSWNDGNLR